MSIDGSTVGEKLPRAQVLTITLVGVAHGCSHFFQLVLPPLFPFLIEDLGTTYTELGVLMTIFFVTSGIGQPLAGFAVDRFRARNVLLLGLGLYVVAVLALSLATAPWMLIPPMILAGLGNCVFHPADYAVLTASVRRSHTGRAYSVHTFGGNIGWAIAPAFMLTIAQLAGWREALVAAAVLGALIWAALWFYRSSLRDEGEPRAGIATAPPIGARALVSPTIVLCFVYFALIAAALIAVQNFLPPILFTLHATPLLLGGAALTGFLVGSSVGVVAGGLIADRSTRHGGVIALGLALSGLAFILAAEIAMGTAVLVGALFTAGFMSGVTTPSRDMLVRSATPPGATGRVFGLVYSGLDVGSALVPITVGLMIDHGLARWALWAVALFLIAAIATVAGIRGSARPAIASA